MFLYILGKFSPCSKGLSFFQNLGFWYAFCKFSDFSRRLAPQSWDLPGLARFELPWLTPPAARAASGCPSKRQGGWYKYTCTHNTMFGFHCVVLTTIWNGSLGGWVLLSNASWNTKSLKVRGLKKSEPLTLNPFLFINFKCSNRKGKLCSQKPWPPLVGG